MKAPAFWFKPPGWRARALAPLAWIYGGIASLRRATAMPDFSPMPVICIGNLTVGGAGKTPCALAVGEILAELGRKPAFLSRGYGGSERGPLKVDPQRHRAAAVGDEPLLLARAFPTYIGAKRGLSARLAIADGADVLVMDDGLHNPSLQKDYSIVLVDGATGFGNLRVLPAGPLRERLDRGLARADLFVMVGEDRRRYAAKLALRAPVLRSYLSPDDAAEDLKGRRVFAFAGIAQPEKFFLTLVRLGAEIVGTRGFDDHHPYGEADLAAIAAAARAADAIAVTTEKDMVRIPEDKRADFTTVAVSMTFDRRDELKERLQHLLDKPQFRLGATKLR